MENKKVLIVIVVINVLIFLLLTALIIIIGIFFNSVIAIEDKFLNLNVSSDLTNFTTEMIAFRKSLQTDISRNYVIMNMILHQIQLDYQCCKNSTR